MKESPGYFEEEKQEVYDKVRDIYDRKDEVREKFLNLYKYKMLGHTNIKTMHFYAKISKEIISVRIWKPFPISWKVWKSRLQKGYRVN